MTPVRTTLAVALLSLTWIGATEAATRGSLIPDATALHHGLTRAWFSQVRLDPSRGRVTHLVLDGETLLVTTDRAGLHAFDAETGNTLWSTTVGNPEHTLTRPAVNSKAVAVINTSRLYLVNRVTGKALWDKEIDGAASGPPGLSEKRAFVPIVDGRMLAYHLEPKIVKRTRGDESDSPEPATGEEPTEYDIADAVRVDPGLQRPGMCQSSGHPLTQPLVTRQNASEALVVWATDIGHLYVAKVDRKEDHFAILHRLITGMDIASQPTFGMPRSDTARNASLIYVTSRNGSVRAIQDLDGTLAWQFSTGEPILEPAVVVGDSVYVALQSAGMYCLDASTGEEKWWTPNVLQFVAAGKNRLYAIDTLDRLVFLDPATGGRVGAMNIQGLSFRLRNLENDRIYLASPTGLVQCFREVELEEPLVYRHTTVEEPSEEGEGEEEDVLAPPPTDVVEPDAPADDSSNPFEGGDENPFGTGENPFGTEENPFGSGDNPFGSGGGDNPFE